MGSTDETLCERERVREQNKDKNLLIQEPVGFMIGKSTEESILPLTQNKKLRKMRDTCIRVL